MNKKLLHILIAAGVVVVLAAVIILLVVSNNRENERLQNEPQGIPLVDETEEDLTSVMVVNSQDSFTAVMTEVTGSNGEKKQALRLEGYENIPAVEDAFDTLALRATHFSATRMIAEKAESVYDYGLDKPQAKFQSTFRDGSSITVSIGAPVPDDSGLYAMVEGDEAVYIVSFAYLDTFGKTQQDYISRQLIPIYTDNDALKFQSVELAGSSREQPIVITNYHDETSAQLYELTEPFPALTLDDKIQDIISSLTVGLDADGIAVINPTAEQVAEYGLDNPYSTVRFTFEDAEYYLRIGKPQDAEGFVYVMVNDNPLIYRIAASMLEYRDYQLEDVLSSRLFTGNITQLSHVILTANGKEYDFEIDNSESQAGYILNGTRIDSDQGGMFYSNLLLLSRKEVSEKTPSASSPVLTCTLQFIDESREPTEWEVYEDGDGEYLFVIGGKTTASVYPASVQKLCEDLEKLSRGEEIEAVY